MASMSVACWAVGERSMLKDLFGSYPRNIRRRLLRDIVAVLLLIFLLLLSSGLYLGLNVRRDISATLIYDTTVLAEKRFEQFVSPVKATLGLGRLWGEGQLYRGLDDNQLQQLLLPLLKIYPHLSAVMLADSQGGEFFLQHGEANWLRRRFSIGKEGKGHAVWRQWSDGGPPKQWQEDLRYDPRERPWFSGATARPGTVFWTEPYTFFTSRKPGVTAAIAWRGNGGREYVFAMDLLEEELLSFLDSLDLGQKGHIALLGMDNKIIAQNKSVAADSGELVAKALSRWRDEAAESLQVMELSSGGQQWWAGVAQLERNSSGRIVVVLPEEAIMARVQQRWYQWGMLAALVLGAGIIFAHRLVARYSYQLKDLPRQHIAGRHVEDELRTLIAAGESSTLEFKSTMRMNLKSGKKGKEIELAWLKAVVAFMNSDGGILLIGVDDQGHILGLEADGFASEDRLRLHFKSLISHHIGPEFDRFLQLKIAEVEGKQVAIIECERVRKPVFLRVGKNEDFFVRSGPSSAKLSMSQMIQYLEDRV